ncbi:AAA family ATPase [Caulobacter sp. ErkDOM-E]|uniref:AAA family ATPase n=1 Tax=Caulobacter sp. ErkDOM-E TaxID=3402778 RepID=UPI003AF63062
MLLRFGVENYYSIKGYTEISLIASGAIKDKGSDLIESSAIRDQVVPICILYGANASGKTNIYQAIRRLRSHIEGSFADRKPGHQILRHVFKLSPDSYSKPTRFDCDVIIGDVRYHYGFEFDDVKYLSEWLFSFPDGRRRMLFTRDENGLTFGKSLRGNNKSIESIVRPNALFLSAAAQGSHEMLTPIFKYFEDNWQGLGAGFEVERVESELTGGVDKRVTNFLKFADTGIVTCKVKTRERDPSSRKMIEGIYRAMKEVASESGSDVPEVDFDSPMSEVFLGHMAGDGEVVELPLGDESRGTIRLISMMDEVFKALDAGTMLCIDEIDVSLHPLIVDEILSLFASKKTNPLGAQLIATTHDTHLISSAFLRRDQIWFCEKSNRGETRVFPLSEFRTRNTDNIERQYLSGRFGAVPYLRGKIDYVKSEH